MHRRSIPSKDVDTICFEEQWIWLIFCWLPLFLFGSRPRSKRSKNGIRQSSRGSTNFNTEYFFGYWLRGYFREGDHSLHPDTTIWRTSPSEIEREAQGIPKHRPFHLRFVKYEVFQPLETARVIGSSFYDRGSALSFFYCILPEIVHYQLRITVNG